MRIPASDLFGLAGRPRLAEVPLGGAYRLRVDSLVELVDHFDAEVARFSDIVADALGRHPGDRAVQAIPGVGPVLAAVFVAEIGDDPASRVRRNWRRGPG